MTALKRWARRLWHILNRRRLERDLEREMASHRAMMDDPRRFGNALRLREQNADVWGWTWIDDLWRDLRYGMRQLVITPRVTIAAVCILALGAGVPLAFLHLTNAVGHYLYAVPEPDTLVRVAEQTRSVATRVPHAAASFYSEHATVFSFLVAENRGWRVSLDDEGEPLLTVFVSADYFQNLRVAPVQGRLLDARDSAASAAPAAVLGEAFWRRRFGGDASIVNRLVRVNGVSVRVVGIVPGTFDGLAPPDLVTAAVWFPFATRPQIAESSPPLDDATHADTQMYGRLAPGMSSAAAAVQLTALTRDLQQRHGGRAAVPDALTVVPLITGMRLEADVAVFFVLFLLIFLSACANLGNLLLARGLSRAREIDMRLALGATRWRIMRQLLVENAVLSLLGCVAATFAGYVGGWLIIRFTDDIPEGLHIVIDARMVLASLVMVVLAVAGFGLTPALQAVGRRRAPTRARQTLVAVQVAGGCVLLILAALLARGGQRARSADLSLDYRRTIALDPQLGVRTLTPDAQRDMLNDLAARVEGLPTVDGVSIAAPWQFVLGRPPLLFQEVGPSYFDVVQLRLIRGRSFFDGEADAVVVSRSAALATWPGQDPLGQTWTSGRGRDFVVVGVVEDSGLSARGNRASGEAYISLAGSSLRSAVLLVHTGGDPRTLLREARNAAARSGITPTASMMAAVMELEPRNHGMSTILRVLGLLASLLAFTGIFTLVGFAVVQRTREIGVRMALGATRSDVLRTLMTQYATPLVAGSAVGVALAAGAAQVLRTQLYGLTPLDPASHAAGLATFAAVALVAILLPARRALRIDPASALRWE